MREGRSGRGLWSFLDGRLACSRRLSARQRNCPRAGEHTLRNVVGDDGVFEEVGPAEVQHVPGVLGEVASVRDDERKSRERTGPRISAPDGRLERRWRVADGGRHGPAGEEEGALVVEFRFTLPLE